VARSDGREDDQLRDIRITRGYQEWPAGSVLVEFGRTRVLCAASVTEGVPRWRAGSGLGWVTAEYAMLPSATNTRTDRESVRGKIGGRTHEISRLVGRSLRACIDLRSLGENTIVIDCDVIQADGGTRTAAITGGYVALADAVTWLGAGGRLADPQPLACAVAAISVGVVDGRVRLDLPYEEDARAEVDMNVVATDAGTIVEVQGTGEGATFTRSTLDRMLDMALAGCAEINRRQVEALAKPYPGELPRPKAGKA
jgi:ribonuclease PH